MNLFLQIAVGTIPAIIIIVLYLIISKRNLVAGGLSLLLLAGAAGGTVVQYLNSDTQDQEDEEEQVQDVQTVGFEEIAELAYGSALEEDYDGARELLKNALSDFTYSPDYTLALARIDALSGDTQAAKALYGKLGDTVLSDSVKNEITLIEDYQKLDQEDLTLLEHFTGTDLSQSEVEELKTQKEQKETELRDAICSNIEVQLGEDADLYKEYAQTLVEAEQLYTSFLEDPESEEIREEAENLLKYFNKVEKEKTALGQVEQVRLSKLKMQVAANEWKDMAQSLDERSGYKELMIVSELYRDGYIKDSYFTGDYAKSNEDETQVVIDQLRENANSQTEDEEEEENQKSYEEYIKVLENALKKPALTQMKKELYEDVEDASLEDVSKIYLQLAKLESETDNQDKVNENLTKALNTVDNCNDTSYAIPMQTLVDVVENKDNVENLKNAMGNISLAQQYLYDFELPTDDTQEDEFDNTFVDYVSKKRTSINITSLDASAFETVKSVISLDSDIAYSAEELKNMLLVEDCGVEITDYDIQKITFKGVNILLCCDVSGSMEGEAITNLKEAVTLFVDNKLKNENIALVTFNDGIKGEYGFDSSTQDLLDAADQIYADGGTDMYEAAIYSMRLFEDDEDTLNCIILLSDGEDNYPRSDEEIQAYLGDPCKSGNIVMYSIGLGSNADANYLSTLAESTGGSYLYVNDSATLYSFYEYLEAQMKNQYVITYKAQDTLTASRDLKVSIKDDDLSYDVEYYSLNGESDITGEELEDMGIISMNNLSITGLETRLLYKSGMATTIKLYGTGFQEDYSVKISLDGNLDYNLKCTYVDENTMELTIPGSIACDVYDMKVTIEGRQAVIKKALAVITQDSETTTKIGPYVFTSLSKTVDGNQTVLSGYVTMNNWLNFKGDVVIYGDTGSSQVEIYDGYGSSIHFNKSVSTGLASYMAKNGTNLSMPALGSVILYNDELKDAGSDDYPVSKIAVDGVYFSNVMTLSTPSLALYPNRFVIDANGFTTKFPYQDQVMKKVGLDDPFSFDIEAKAIITDRNIGVDVDVKMENSDSNNFNTINVGNMPIYANLKKFDLKINTIKNEYSIQFMVRMPFIAQDGIGLKLAWDGDSFIPDEIRFYCNKKINVNFGAIPITFTGFEVAVKDIDVSTSVLNWTLEGSMDVKAAQISAVHPGLEKYIGDGSIASIEDVDVEGSLGQKYIKAKATFKLLNQIELANINLEAGKISYSNELLGMNSLNTTGFVGKVTAGPKWEKDNCKIILNGSLEVAVNSKYTGLTVDGTAEIALEWWVLVKDFSADGAATIGFYTYNDGDKKEFYVSAKGQTKKGKTTGIVVLWNDQSGLDVTTKKYK